MADPLLGDDEVAARGFESIKPQEADLIFDPFQLNFESGKGALGLDGMKIATMSVPALTSSNWLQYQRNKKARPQGRSSSIPASTINYEMDRIFFDQMGIAAPDYPLA